MPDSAPKKELYIGHVEHGIEVHFDTVITIANFDKGVAAFVGVTNFGAAANDLNDRNEKIRLVKEAVQRIMGSQVRWNEN